jgi:hypothetical protein
MSVNTEVSASRPTAPSAARAEGPAARDAIGLPLFAAGASGGKALTHKNLPANMFDPNAGPQPVQPIQRSSQKGILQP